MEFLVKIVAYMLEEQYLFMVDFSMEMDILFMAR